MLKPKATAYAGLCEAEFLHVSFRTADGRPPPSAALSMPPLAEPQARADGVTTQTLYKKIGDVAPVRGGGVDQPTEARCGRIANPEGFITAPHADSVWLASSLLSLAASQVRSRNVTFKVACGAASADCVPAIEKLETIPITYVSASCSPADWPRLSVPEMSTCVDFSVSDAPSNASSGHFWRVAIVASVRIYDSGATTMELQSVAVRPMNFVID